MIPSNCFFQPGFCSGMLKGYRNRINLDIPGHSYKLNIKKHSKLVLFRIRAKSQGMALSLGDKINICQKTRQKKIVSSQG